MSNRAASPPASRPEHYGAIPVALTQTLHDLIHGANLALRAAERLSEPSRTHWSLSASAAVLGQFWAPGGAMQPKLAQEIRHAGACFPA